MENVLGKQAQIQPESGGEEKSFIDSKIEQLQEHFSPEEMAQRYERRDEQLQGAVINALYDLELLLDERDPKDGSLSQERVVTIVDRVVSRLRWLYTVRSNQNFFFETFSEKSDTLLYSGLEEMKVAIERIENLGEQLKSQDYVRKYYTTFKTIWPVSLADIRTSVTDNKFRSFMSAVRAELNVDRKSKSFEEAGVSEDGE